MKKIIALLAFLIVGSGAAQAQLVDLNTGASVNANVNVGKSVTATTSVEVKANNNIKKDNGSTTASTTIKGNSTSTVATSKNNNSTTSSASVVSLSAREIRGWSEEEKSDFLLTVKSHAELQSGQDLENFAKGVIATDANVDTVVADDSHVEVSYKLPAKFLGIFRTEIDAMTNVSFDTETSGNGPKEVTVKFPWYKMFYSLDSEARAEVLENAIEASVSDTSASTTVSSRNGKVIQLISSVLKNIRASVETDVSVE